MFVNHSCSKCFEGDWICNSIPCQKECAAIGHSHYRTFDDFDYTFTGTCSYIFSTNQCNVTKDTDQDYTFTVSAQAYKACFLLFCMQKLNLPLK